jgi:hypothetical protein
MKRRKDPKSVIVADSPDGTVRVVFEIVKANTGGQHEELA